MNVNLKECREDGFKLKLHLSLSPSHSLTEYFHLFVIIHREAIFYCPTLCPVLFVLSWKMILLALHQCFSCSFLLTFPVTRPLHLCEEMRKKSETAQWEKYTLSMQRGREHSQKCIAEEWVERERVKLTIYSHSRYIGMIIFLLTKSVTKWSRSFALFSRIKGPLEMTFPSFFFSLFLFTLPPSHSAPLVIRATEKWLSSLDTRRTRSLRDQCKWTNPYSRVHAWGGRVTWLVYSSITPMSHRAMENRAIANGLLYFHSHSRTHLWITVVIIFPCILLSRRPKYTDTLTQDDLWFWDATSS